MKPLLRRLTMPQRYMAVVLGSLLFLAASDGAVLLRGSTATPLVGLGTFLASLAGMLCLFAASWRLRHSAAENATTPADDNLYQHSASSAHRGVQRALAVLQSAPFRTLPRYLVLAVGVALALDSLIALILGVTLLLAPPSQAYPTDAISFAHADATFVLSGTDPYTSDARFSLVLRAYPHTLATPLRGHIFGTGYEYPPDARILAVQRRYIANPAQTTGAFDPATLHSYPALSFLLYVPLLAVGLSNILLLHILLYAGLLVWLVRLAPSGMRRWAALAAGANAIVLGYAFLGDAQGVCLAALVAAWHYRSHRWVSSGLLGLACAYRQYCWFFVPFFLLAWALEGTGTRVGSRDTPVRRTVSPALIALCTFLLPNLPYIFAAPGPWFASLWLPMTDPMFPNGMGLDAVFTGNLLPYIPSPAFAALEGMALLGSLWAAVRWRDHIGDGILLLALVPLLFAYRSLPNYFAVAPWIALYAANHLYATGARAKNARQHAGVPAVLQLVPEETV